MSLGKAQFVSSASSLHQTNFLWLGCWRLVFLLRMAQLALKRLLHCSIVRLSDCSTDAHYNQVHPVMLQPGLIVIPKQTALAGKLELPTLRLIASRFKQLHYGSKLFAGPIAHKPMDRHHSPRIRRCPQAHAHLFPEYKFYTTMTSLQ